VMTFDSTVHHFGSVEQGTLIEHNFRFTNTGKAPLVIERALASDGGGLASFEKKIYAPGESGFIKMTQSTTGRMGMMDKTATINYNSASWPVVLHLKGNVIPPSPPTMKFDSASYSFGKVKQGERVNLELHFINTGKEPLIISSANTTCGCDVAAFPREPIPPGGPGTIKYTLDTTGRSRIQNKPIYITYNTNQLLTISIYGEVVAN
jgi:hypothetical protein